MLANITQYSYAIVTHQLASLNSHEQLQLSL